MNTDCIFCKIISKEIPSHIIYEDDHSIAFLTIAPHTKGHTIVAPKEHSRNIFDVSEKDLEYILRTVKKVSAHLRDNFGASGVNIGQNNEKQAGQEVFHTHFHIIPRYQDDGLKHWATKETTKEGLEKIASQLRMD